MRPAAWANTSSKRVLGSMNDFAFALDYYLEDGLSPEEIMLRFADTPKSAIGVAKRDYGRPAATALALLHGRR